ncbi:hypothetical protein D7V78_02330 [Parabacteroides distasonis]|uniref:DUF6194 domain-containing protein n=1 Tax=Parabacteroides distasonis TaxID=823 RepID=A0A3L7ZX17_PARDI|nr:hypothetical protein [Parabacteroides distasonis]RLT74873.1 hypothetical protein D7V78_02330 [Parabacteroides distasonis]
MRLFHHARKMISMENRMPHPVYAWMGWICALSPSETTFESLKPYILESYEYAKEKFSKRK